MLVGSKTTVYLDSIGMYCMYKNDYLKKVTKDWNTIDWVPIFEWAILLNWFDSCLNAWAECMSKFQKVSKNKTHILTLQNSSSNSRKGVRKFDGIFKMPGCDSLCAVKDVLNCSTTDVRLCFCYSPTVGISCYKQKLLTPPTFWRGVFSAGFTPPQEWGKFACVLSRVSQRASTNFNTTWIISDEL